MGTRNVQAIALLYGLTVINLLSACGSSSTDPEGSAGTSNAMAGAPGMAAGGANQAPDAGAGEANGTAGSSAAEGGNAGEDGEGGAAGAGGSETASPYAGVWVGQLSTGAGISLTVEGAEVTDVSTCLVATYMGQTCRGPFTMEDAPATIVDGVTSVNLIGENAAVPTTLNVVFDSTDLATGGFGDVTGNGLVCAADPGFVSLGSDETILTGESFPLARREQVEALPPPESVTSVWQSSGCGLSGPSCHTHATTGSSDFNEYTITLTGASLAGPDPANAGERTFFVRTPQDYDATTPYRVVYLGSGCGPTFDPSFAYPLYNEGQGGREDTIYVVVAYPQGEQCYDTSSGDASSEWEMFEAVHSFIESQFCVDNNRVFVGGYSTAGTLANMLGCYFAGTDPNRQFAPNFRVRGQASVAGTLPASLPVCNGPVAGLWIHDTGDTAIPIQGAFDARDRVLEANGCSGSASMAWPAMPDACLQYTDCPSEYPVVFCTTSDSQHASQEDRALQAFTAFFDMMDP